MVLIPITRIDSVIREICVFLEGKVKNALLAT